MSNEILSERAKKALKHIRDQIMMYGKVPSIRGLGTLMGYKSPLSPMLIMEELAQAGFIRKKDGGGYLLVKDLGSPDVVRTVDIPLVGSAPCGAPLLAEQNIEAMISVSTTLIQPGSKYFLLRAIGDSMNLGGIQDSDLVLVKQQQAPDFDKQQVVVLIEDEATIKQLHKSGDVYALLPQSSNSKHKPILLNSNFRIQGVVIKSIGNIY